MHPFDLLRALHRPRPADPPRQVRPRRAAARSLHAWTTDFVVRRGSSSCSRDMTLTINAFFGWDFNSLRGAAQGRRLAPDRLREPVPGLAGDVAALPLPVAREGEPALVDLLRGDEARDAARRSTGSRSTRSRDKDLPYAREAARRTRKIARRALRDRALRGVLRASTCAHLDEVAWEFFGTPTRARTPCARRSRRCSRRTRSSSSPSCSGSASRRGASDHEAGADGEPRRQDRRRAGAASALQRDVTLVRWGHFGQPVLLFPTAGGDAEEIERFHLIDALGAAARGRQDQGLLVRQRRRRGAGRSARAAPQHRMWLQNQFHQYIRHEVVPAIRIDCKTDDIEVWAAGASIGAFHAVAVRVPVPRRVHQALAMTGTYDLRRFYDAPQRRSPTTSTCSSPLHFVPTLAGRAPRGAADAATSCCRRARARPRTSASRGGWRTCSARQGIPNRVDSWGTDWPHDWLTWRKMLPQIPRRVD